MQKELFNEDVDLGDSRGPLTLAFDTAADVTLRRMDEYGHPLDDFKKVELIKRAVSDCKHPEIRHCLEMIGVKLARLAHDHTHFDSTVDVAGYARCINMVLDEERARRIKMEVAECPIAQS